MEKDKRYLVFAWYDYYPSGGMYDCKGSFDTVEEARKCEGEFCSGWDQTSVYDRVEGIEL